MWKKKQLAAAPESEKEQVHEKVEAPNLLKMLEEQREHLITLANDTDKEIAKLSTQINWIKRHPDYPEALDMLVKIAIQAEMRTQQS